MRRIFYKSILLAGLLSVCLAATAEAKPLLTSEDAHARITRAEPTAEIRWCHRKSRTHIRCRVIAYAIGISTVENEAGEVIEETETLRLPIPLMADVGLRGIAWSF